MPVILQLPKSIGRKPVVVIAIKQNRGVVGNARLAQQLLERLFADQIATDIVLKLRLPVPAYSAGNVALIVSAGIDIDFHQPDFRVIEVLGSPFCGYQNFRVLVFGHLRSPRTKIEPIKKPAVIRLAAGFSKPGCLESGPCAPRLPSNEICIQTQEAQPQSGRLKLRGVITTNYTTKRF